MREASVESKPSPPSNMSTPLRSARTQAIFHLPVQSIALQFGLELRRWSSPSSGGAHCVRSSCDHTHRTYGPSRSTGSVAVGLTHLPPGSHALGATLTRHTRCRATRDVLATRQSCVEPLSTSRNTSLRQPTPPGHGRVAPGSGDGGRCAGRSGRVSPRGVTVRWFF